MNYLIEEKDNKVIMKINEKDFTITCDTEEMRSSIIHIIQSSKVSEIIYDITDVKYMDSSAIGLIIAPIQYKIKVKLLGANDFIKSVFTNAMLGTQIEFI